MKLKKITFEGYTTQDQNGQRRARAAPSNLYKEPS